MSTRRDQKRGVLLLWLGFAYGFLLSRRITRRELAHRCADPAGVGCFLRYCEQRNRRRCHAA